MDLKEEPLEKIMLPGKRAISTESKNCRVVFLGKIKEYVACKQPNKEDKIPSKVTWEGLK